MMENLKFSLEGEVDTKETGDGYESISIHNNSDLIRKYHFSEKQFINITYPVKNGSDRILTLREALKKKRV